MGNPIRIDGIFVDLIKINGVDASYTGSNVQIEYAEIKRADLSVLIRQLPADIIAEHIFTDTLLRKHLIDKVTDEVVEKIKKESSNG